MNYLLFYRELFLTLIIKLKTNFSFEFLRQVLFDVQSCNSNLAKLLGEESKHAMYKDQNPQGGLLSLQNYQN